MYHANSIPIFRSYNNILKIFSKCCSHVLQIYNYFRNAESRFTFFFLPLLGGAFFKDTTRVATAFSTNDISESLNLESIITTKI